MSETERYVKSPRSEYSRPGIHVSEGVSEIEMDDNATKSYPPHSVEAEDNNLLRESDDSTTDMKDVTLHDDGNEVVEGRQRADSGALDLRLAVDIWTWDNFGYLAQYYAVGLIYGGIPATVYGFFLGYLNVPSYIYATAAVITSLPWSFKFAFGLLNDCFPIKGFHRKPYMVIGWSMCTLMLIVMAFTPLPAPYWCQDENGHYIHTNGTDANGKTIVATPCNPHAAKEGGFYAQMMMLAALGYVVADVAADGLTVQYARREPIEERGQTQTTIYLVRTCGSITASILVAFGMNGPEYNGTFDHGMSFNAIMGILSVPAAIMIPCSWFRVVDTEVDEPPVLKEYLSDMWKLLQSKAMFWVIIYTFVNPMIANITTTAGGSVKLYWAEVQNLQNQLFSLVGLALFALGLWLVKKYFLAYSWRGMLIITTVFLNVVDMCFVYPTVLNVYRNQYFYLGETVVYEIPLAANFVVATFYIVEMCDDGNEGLVYGLLTTISNLGGPFAQALSNQIFAEFSPSLSDSDNYVKDEESFRHTVAWSFTLSYIFSFCSIAFVFFLPVQKEQAQQRKRDWPSDVRYAWVTVIVLSISFCYSILVNILSMYESTMCLKFAGGDGC